MSSERLPLKSFTAFFNLAKKQDNKMAFNKPGPASKRIQSINQDKVNKWITDIYFLNTFF